MWYAPAATSAGHFPASCCGAGGSVSPVYTPTAAPRAAVVRINVRRTRRTGTRAYLASALRAAALSVRSQVNSGSVRPKWPNAAVLR